MVIAITCFQKVLQTGNILNRIVDHETINNITKIIYLLWVLFCFVCRVGFGSPRTPTVSFYFTKKYVKSYVSLTWFVF